MEYFLQGLTMGLAYVAPIGLQNLFVINSALTYTRQRALLTALIVIFFDVALSLACFFGIGTIMQRYDWLKPVILLFGSLIVIYIGVSLLRAKAEALDEAAVPDSVAQTITTACVVTWFNPQAIIDGTMMLGAFHVTLPEAQSLTFIAGVVTASCLWFTGLTLMISVFRDRLGAVFLCRVNIVCGGVIVFYGVKLLLNFWELV
ncbi:LysE family transporter [uncultured Phascolarctobacterium sp.]|uniref:LysE/ArgO family amino acid transporter n=1 Tax=uncultured Phascolarctobacterium sp. TaxID=512296 RepID=UPI00343A9CC5